MIADELPPGFLLLRGWCQRGMLAELAATLPWRQESTRLYGREVALPRLTCWLGDEGATYRYSGIEHRPAPWGALVSELRDLATQAAAIVEVAPSFNSCLGNLYRGGGDSVAWHADDEPELGPEPVIASLSFGAMRRFKIRERATRCVWDLDLADGDLLVMRGRSQLDYEHAVPKTAREVGPRVNLTFRRVATK